MAKKRATHTLWTNPMDDWTRLFEGVEITDNEVEQAVDAVKQRDRTEVEERIWGVRGGFLGMRVQLRRPISSVHSRYTAQFSV